MRCRDDQRIRKEGGGDGRKYRSRILQGMLEDAWDKGVEQERRNTEKEREHAIVAFISFGIPKEKILEKGYTEEEYTKVKKKLLS